MVLSGMNSEGKQFAYELDVRFERKKRDCQRRKPEVCAVVGAKLRTSLMKEV